MPAHGHINPTLAVTSSLVKKGYRVTYAMAERFAPVLRSIGADVVALDDSSVVWEGFSSNEEKGRADQSADRAKRVRETQRIVDVFRADTPDLIIHDFLSVEGTLLAKQIPAIPSIKCFPTFAHNATFPFAMGGWGGTYEKTKGQVEALKTLLDTDFSSGFGEYFCEHISECNVVFIPSFFQYRSETFDERFFFVGPSIAERAFYGKWSPPREAPKTILISLGTVLNAQLGFFRMCIDALQSLGMHVVISVGKGVEISSLRSIPSGFEVHQFVSHIDVLPHASAFIGHGGMNSTMEALYFGVPLLLAPQDGHQQLIAERAVQLGFGKMLPVPNCSPETLRDSLLSILDEAELAARIRTVGIEMRKGDAVLNAVAVIERYLRG
jgi:MGT family glycosyltransferase